MGADKSRRKTPTSREKLTVAQSDLRRVRRACERLEAARLEVRAAIKDAHASGESYRDIAEWARMSHQRVAQIVKE
jgi:hypothetical protein